VTLRSIVRRLRRDEAGFGLVELLIAMTILSVGVFALLATYSSSSVALVRSARIGTAVTLADKQMELYRGLLYDDIRLASATIPTSGTYTSTGSPYTGSAQVTTPACTGSPAPDECNASRAVTGPDGRSYQVEVYIYPHTPSGGGREIKSVTVVVRDNADSSRVLARQESTFDPYTGCVADSC
jgi:prepilin-type N-terminal cleavage/methylation domain-containing protein